MEKSLWKSIENLAPLNPEYVSVTYGAGGSTRERTHQTIKRIIDETTLTPAAHLTCVGASKQEVDEIAKDYWDMGVRHIVALRGDMPGEETYTPHPEGYEYALDLVKGLLDIGDFNIAVTAYPEVHPQAPSAEFDMQYLKEKLDAGADHAITQYFFDTDVYFRFLDNAEKAGITKSIVPGVMPIASVQQMLKFSKMCGASVPKWVRDLLDGMDDTPEERQLIAMMIAAEQTRLLVNAGVEHIHFYTLNRFRLTAAICRIMGILPK